MGTKNVCLHWYIQGIKDTLAIVQKEDNNMTPEENFWVELIRNLMGSVQEKLRDLEAEGKE